MPVGSPSSAHTDGECGVAIQEGDGGLLHIGDAYAHADLTEEDAPVTTLAAQRADDVS